MSCDQVERWRAIHEPVQSASWIKALRKLADDKISAVEIDESRPKARESASCSAWPHIAKFPKKNKINCFRNNDTSALKFSRAPFFLP